MAERRLMLLGEAASPGVARGSALLCGCGDIPLASDCATCPDDGAGDIERFDAAVSAAEAELDVVQRQVLEEIGADEAAIFGAQAVITRDPGLREAVRTLCLERRMSVEAALAEAIEARAQTLLGASDAMLRERAADLRDVGARLRALLTLQRRSDATRHPDGTILVARELLPSVIMRIDERAVRGVVVAEGGHTAHATILARARGIPVVIRAPEAMARVQPDDELIVDGLSGRVFVNPTREVQEEYDRLEESLLARRSALAALIDAPSVTRDGTPIRVRATIGKVADAAAAARVGAEGVGLYRTEFAFLTQDHFPSEDEQVRLYRAAVEHLAPEEVVIRTLDIGSDKHLPYFPLARETNPALGRRGTRLLLSHLDVLHVQLRSILRVSATNNVAILFPMVGGVEELRAARAAIERAKASLDAQGLSFARDVPVGVMVETPSAVLLAARLAREADFLSVGTNDLVQYLLATDRASGELASYYAPLHPAVVQALGLVARAAAAQGTGVAVCGEMAGNPAFTELLVGLGFRSFSVNPGELLEIRNSVRSLDVAEAEALADHALQLETVEEVKHWIQVEERQPGSTDRGA